MSAASDERPRTRARMPGGTHSCRCSTSSRIERVPPQVGARPGAEVEHDLEDAARRAAHELALAERGAPVEPAEHAVAGSRLALLRRTTPGSIPTSAGACRSIVRTKKPRSSWCGPGPRTTTTSCSVHGRTFTLTPRRERNGREQVVLDEAVGRASDRAEGQVGALGDDEEVVLAVRLVEHPQQRHLGDSLSIDAADRAVEPPAPELRLALRVQVQEAVVALEHVDDRR